MELGREHKLFRKINRDSMRNPRVALVAVDAFEYIKNTEEFFDLVVMDLPDPNDYSLGKLYSKEFFVALKKRMSKYSAVVTQSTSPYFARKAFWCINKTLGSVFENVLPYKVYVPSFGLWGFNAASDMPIKADSVKIEVETRYLCGETLPELFKFGRDISALDTEINAIENQALVSLYEQSWKEWN